MNENEAKRPATYRIRLAERVAEHNNATAVLLARTATVERHKIALAEKKRKLMKVDDELEAENRDPSRTLGRCKRT